MEQDELKKAGYCQDKQAGTPGQKFSVIVWHLLRPKQTLTKPLGVHLAVTELEPNIPSLKVGDGLDSYADLLGLISTQDRECS